MSNKSLTNEQIVDIYMDAYLNGTSLTKAAKAHGVSTAVLDWRARRLRHAGVKLPRKYTAHEADVDALNAIIKSKLAPEDSKGQEDIGD